MQFYSSLVSFWVADRSRLRTVRPFASQNVAILTALYPLILSSKTILHSCAQQPCNRCTTRTARRTHCNCWWVCFLNSNSARAWFQCFCWVPVIPWNLILQMTNDQLHLAYLILLCIVSQLLCIVTMETAMKMLCVF